MTLSSISHPIRSDIKAGSVYYYNDPEIKTTYRHYCIVVNINPIKDTAIILVYAQHRINKVKERRTGFPVETLVEIEPIQYREFKKKSIIDCNTYLERDINMIVNKLEQGKLVIKPVMGLRLVRILRRGLIASNQVPQRIKDLLRE